MTPIRGSRGPSASPSSSAIARRHVALPASALAENVAGSARSVAGSHSVEIDAVDDADEAPHVPAQERVERLAALRRQDLARVRRADRGDRVGEREPALQQAHLIVELERVQIEVRPRDAELGHRLLGEDPAVGEVVDRRDHHAADRGDAGVDRRRCALPVVDVQHVVRIFRRATDEAMPVLDRGLAERREPHVVVPELAGAAGAVQRAGAIVERWTIDEAIRDAADARDPEVRGEAMRPDLELESEFRARARVRVRRSGRRRRGTAARPRRRSARGRRPARRVARRPRRRAHRTARTARPRSRREQLASSSSISHRRSA